MIRKTLVHCSLLLALAGGVNSALAQGTTAFSYQGKLTDSGSPATGIYDFQFSLHDVAAGAYRNTVATNDVGVTNGVFSVTLDFGSTWFDGRQLMMQVLVRPGTSTGSYTPLLPLQPILAVPYATYAAKAGSVINGAINANHIANGEVVKSINGKKDNVTLAAGANVTITPSGNTLTVSSSGGAFSLNGASAYYNGGNVGIGTANPQARLHVEGDAYLSGRLVSAGESLTIQNAANGGRLALGSVGGNNRVYLAGVNAASTASADELIVGGRGLANLPRLSLQADTTSVNGKVGIGTASPAGGLQVASGGVAVTGASSPYTGTKGLYMESWDLGFGDGVGVLFAYDYFANAPMDLAINSPGGNVGIGTYAPREKLHVAGGYALVDGWGGEQAYLGGDGWSIDVQIGSFNPTVRTISAWNAGNNTWMDFRAQNIVANGSLTILGGADFAEPFHVSTKDAPKGAVMVIDEANPGQLKVSEGAYDSRVAGIISGAGGVNPGITLQQEGVLEGGRNVALSGRVYVQADASEHPIKPGDLLTTSDVPGHAMKALDQDRAQGAILGKAMTALPDGRGLVLVLVSLQ